MHIVVTGCLLLGLLAILILPSPNASARRESQALILPTLNETPIDAIIETPITEIEQSVEAVESKRIAVIEESVRSGDSLSTIFHRAGLSDRDVYEVVSSSQAGKELAKLYPGHRFIFTLDESGKLYRLSHVINKLSSQTFTRGDQGFAHDTHNRKPDIKVVFASHKIESSLYNAGKAANLDEATIMELAGIFGWDVDFALDIRSGDSFKIVFEESYLDGEKIGVGNVLAAEFVNQGSSFKAVRYVDVNGRAQYYTPSGKAMRKAFLRAPLDFRRISSNFNPRRLHPISKTVKPHRGTDYAANRGTPVWASGDGRVVASGYTKANGNYVIIQHCGDIQTKYLHLHKRLVKKGDKVRQKQVIGSVGSTGYSTAPHLHYEFLLNGVHRNPRTIVQKLPKAKSVPEDQLQRFFKQTQPLLAELEQTTQMASAEPNTQSL